MNGFGVEWRLELSPYRKTIDYGTCKIEYCFSSQKFLDVFALDADTGKSQVNLEMMMLKKTGFKCSLRIVADLALYRKIEQRGFYIIINGDVEVWRTDYITFDGGNPIIKGHSL